MNSSAEIQTPLAPAHVAGLPFLGHTLSFVTKNGLSAEYLLKLRQQYGDLVHFSVMKDDFYLVNDPELVRQVLLTRVEEFPKPEAVSEEPTVLARFLGHGILTAGYEQWRPQRKLIQPLMQHQQIAEYAHTMTKMGQRLLAGWTPWETRDISTDMTQVTMWIIAETMFGADIEQGQKLQELADEAQHIIVDDLAAALPAWLTRRDARTRSINSAFTELVNQFVAESKAQGHADRRDLLSILLDTRDEHGHPMSPELIRDNILTMFLAGHETTANTLTWALYYLSQHPYIRQQLQQEVDAVLEGQRLPTVEDLPNLPYTLMVIKEAMRIQPTVSLIPRAITQDTLLGGYTLKANSILLISPYVMHHDERKWSDPEVFDPQRFTAEKERQIDKYQYMPFGAGPRICIGNHFALMEAHILLALIASRFDLQLQPGARVEPLHLVTTSPKGGLPMVVKPRSFSN